MALLCNEVKMKENRIWCKVSDMPCAFVRYCGISNKYYQTDNALKCKLKGAKDGDEK